MTAPTVGTFTARLYGRLPELYQAADEALEDGPDGYPLLRYVSLLGDQADEVETLLDRAQAGDLANPATADAAWLPWLAQLVGVDLADHTDPAARRSVIAGANDVAAHGSEGAVRRQVQPLLTGDRTVFVEPHYGSQWTVAVVTLLAESGGTTPAAILAAAAVEKPAGVVLVHDYGLSWATLEAGYPTWSTIDAAGSWGNLG